MTTPSTTVRCGRRRHPRPRPPLVGASDVTCGEGASRRRWRSEARLLGRRPPVTSPLGEGKSGGRGVPGWAGCVRACAAGRTVPSAHEPQRFLVRSAGVTPPVGTSLRARCGAPRALPPTPGTPSHRSPTHLFSAVRNLDAARG